eukprot:4361374-Prymnesium_polylepis.1
MCIRDRPHTERSARAHFLPGMRSSRRADISALGCAVYGCTCDLSRGRLQDTTSPHSHKWG